MSAPKEDRYQLLKASGLNTSPIVLLAGSEPSDTSAGLGALAAGPPDAEVLADDGVRHRLWIVPGDHAAALDLLGLVASAPLTIADGHHRYETALRYREERGANRACESDPAWDYVLALVYPTDRCPAALPTHRVIRGGPSGEALFERLAAYGSLDRLPHREALLAQMAAPAGPPAGKTGTGRVGVITGDLVAVLRLDRHATDGLLDVELSEASRGLDVNALSAILERVYGDEPGVMADQGRLWYLKDALEAARRVEDGVASAGYLLDAMPAVAVAQVARAGEVMPHKSTYFDPKAPTGLLFSPMEW
jgi:uncharacterized protein (DUF1015 family)